MNSFFASVEEFVTANQGDHVIKKILIANNGLGAIKAIRSIRKWAFETFGNERMIQFVVMATPDDFKANAEFIRAADEVVDVPGGTNNNNYANINLICEIAVRNQVDAVMPLWGHASENPLLPTSLLALPRKVTFIGPAAAPMQALGDKIGSTIIAQSAGVPTIAWNGDGLTVDYKSTGIPDEVYARANVTTAEDALACAERIGYPVMIKASEGGGGKGIRKVTRSEDVPSLYRQVQSEIPGSPIFVMRMASRARHLEVQLLADKYGEAIALSGRDCSVQRRHQKIIEEGPPVAAPLHVFKRMEQAAVALAKTVGYSSAGTVEYLYMEDTQEFAFLELNPRLQVEHPVTENILGINIPACQLMVAMGLPLHRISDVRRLYGRHILGKDSIDFDFTERAVQPRHCIAVRITAENPEERFQPTSGSIRELQFRSAVDVWGYFSVDNNGRVHEFADSQFGHLFASGKDRESARRAMIVALKELQIRGEIRTTVEYIIKLMQSDDFVANRIDTMWLDGRIEQHKQLTTIENLKYAPPSSLIALCGAALQGYRSFEQKGEEFISLLQVGQIPGKDTLSPKVAVELIFENIKYVTNVYLSGPHSLLVECNHVQQPVNIRRLSDGGYLFDISNKSHLGYLSNETGGSLRLILDGHTCMFTPEYDPTRLVSSVAGKFARQLISNNSHVNAGDAYVEIEVMKMYMPLKASESGIVTFQMSEGAALAPGDVIATMVLDFPEKVSLSEKFTGVLSVPLLVGSITKSPHVIMREALLQIHKVFDGYLLTEHEIEEAVITYLNGFDDRLVAVYELDEAMAILRGRIDSTLFSKITELNANYKAMILAVAATHSNNISATTTVVWPEFPAVRILSLLHDYSQSQSLESRVVFLNQTTAVWSIVEQYLYSSEVRKLAAIQLLLEKYISVERLFDNMSFTDVVTELRKEHTNDLTSVLLLCRSHINYKDKNNLLIRILEEMKTLPFANPLITTIHNNNNNNNGNNYNFNNNISLPPIRNEINIRGIKLLLKELAKLRQLIYNHVSFTAATLLVMNQSSIRPETRRQRLHETISAVLSTGVVVVGGGNGNRPSPPHHHLLSNSGSNNNGGNNNGGVTSGSSKGNSTIAVGGNSDDVNGDSNSVERALIIKRFVDSNIVIRDLLFDLLQQQQDKDYRIALMEIYLLKIYQATHHLSRMICGHQLIANNNATAADNDFTSWIKFDFYTKRVQAVVVDSNNNNNGGSTGIRGSRSTQNLLELSTTPSSPASHNNNNNNSSASNLIHPLVQGHREGIFAVIKATTDLAKLFPHVVNKLTLNNNNNSNGDDINAIHIILMKTILPATTTTSTTADYNTDEDISAYLSSFLSGHVELLKQHRVRRVTFMTSSQRPSSSLTTTTSDAAANLSTTTKTRRSLSFNTSIATSTTASSTISLFTFRLRKNFAEDFLFRHIEAPHAYHLELPRLSNFVVTLENMPTTSGNVFVYRGIPKVKPLAAAATAGANKSKGPSSLHFFVRLVSYASEQISTEMETLFLEALDILGIVMSRERGTSTTTAATTTITNNIFLNLVAPNAIVQIEFYEKEIRRLCHKYWEKLIRLSATTVEVKLNGRLSAESQPLAIRIVATNPTGYVLKIHQYFEEVDTMTGKAVFRTLTNATNNNTSSNGNDRATESTSNTLSGSSSTGPWEGMDVNSPYEVTARFQKQRAEAMAASDTLYVYDWPSLFEHGIEQLWQQHHHQQTHKNQQQQQQHYHVFKCEELVLCEASTGLPLAKGWTAKQAEAATTILKPINREPGLNDCGMVAWLITYSTPTNNGNNGSTTRQIVVICNDITYYSGSFGTKEDIMFFHASQFARFLGIPRLFLTANSGARIGMAQSLKSKFQIQWVDSKDTTKGFRYIYLTAADYEDLLKTYNGNVSLLPVRCTPVVVVNNQQAPGKTATAKSTATAGKKADTKNTDDNSNNNNNNSETHYIITDIIGEEADLGVENLMGSGLIAGETSRAYDDIFTLTLVIGRTVGIGAYLVRLGQRTIQRTHSSPIILTGYQALNKLMGREIYTTNDQLGGPMIMFPNGVSHLLAETHLESVMKALLWLSYVPAKKGAALPIVFNEKVDVVERAVVVTPMKGLTYDPRTLLCGVYPHEHNNNNNFGLTNSFINNHHNNGHDDWQAGFLDKDSFVEVLSGWAKTVVVGRGRLGGIPVGVIITENRTANITKPADPADRTTTETLVSQAGGVWFPDSAYKTSSALNNFNHEELPTIIFANWRGFSGGQRDMFDEVLKFGSMIVDALVAYQQPLFVYIPPFAELRGGSWVVVDSTINADVMEFYAAEESRGGVLEAAGAASIKFRENDIVATAHRVDHALRDLDQQLLTAKQTLATQQQQGEQGKDNDEVTASPPPSSASTTAATIQSLEKQIKQRERQLFGVYQQVAVHFADLHDTPGRMEAKGVIKKQVDWKQSRSFFFWRLKRRLFEFQLANQVNRHSNNNNNNNGNGKKLSKKEFGSLLHQWFVSEVFPTIPATTTTAAKMWEDDKAMVLWYEASSNQATIQQLLNRLTLQATTTKLSESLLELTSAAKDGSELTQLLTASLSTLTPEARAKALAALKAL